MSTSQDDCPPLDQQNPPDASSVVPLSYSRIPKESDAGRIAMTVVAFLVSIIGCAILCTFIWGSFVDGNLYQCTDGVGFGFLGGPRSWVHGDVIGQPGNYGDTIKPGWTLGRLELLWAGFIIASVAISAVIGLRFCRRMPRREDGLWLERDSP